MESWLLSPMVPVVKNGSRDNHSHVSSEVGTATNITNVHEMNHSSEFACCSKYRMTVLVMLTVLT